MPDQTAAIIRKCKLCENMSQEQIQLLLSDHGSMIRTYQKGEYIFQEGDTPEKLYILLSGRIDIGKDTLSGKKMILVTIDQTAEMFGEVYLFLGRPSYDMYARSLEKTVVLSLASSIFQQKSKGNQEMLLVIQHNLMSIFARKAYAMNGKLRVLGGASLREKIVRFLFERQDSYGNICGQMSREDMADYLNVTRPSLSRELGKMHEEGILIIQGRTIEIKDQDRFESYL